MIRVRASVGALAALAAMAVPAAMLLVGAVGEAHGGGMFLPLRGVRATGRGGAFVAGADDAAALWSNPAGLAALARGLGKREQKTSVLVDAAMVGHSVTYTRIDSGGMTLAPAVNDPEALPVPTIAATFDLSPKLVLGIGAFTPYTSIDGYGDGEDADAPQRYSLVSLHGSKVSIVEVALGWQVTERLRIGAGLQNLFLGFRSRVVFSSCPGETVCAPEDPDWDALGEVEQNAMFNPSGVVGVQLAVNRHLQLGAAVQLPFLVDSAGTVRVRLPATGFFNGAHVEGDQADVSLDFPAMIRVAAEIRAADRWRVEAGLDWELWSMHDEIRIVPKNIRIEDAAGLGTYELGPIRIPRNFEDTIAMRLGVEGQPVSALALTVRAGYVFETGAPPDEYLSVLTVDGTKHVLTFGLGYQLGRARIDAVVAQVFVADRNVAAGVSCSPQLNPIRTGEDPALPTACVHDGDPDHVYVGDGRYESSWTVVGAGLNLDF